MFAWSTAVPASDLLAHVVAETKQVPTREPSVPWTLPAEFEPEAFVASLSVDDARREEIASYKQRSDEWRAARYGRLTASQFGAAAGHHDGPAKTRDALRAMLWPESHALTGFAARAAAYGTENESVALSMYSRAREAHARVWETGLLVSTEHGWLAASPDFVVEETTVAADRPYVIEHAAESATPHARTAWHAHDARVIGCGEIKCPTMGRFYSTYPKHAERGIPHYYYDQIQGAMAIGRWPWSDFVVYTPAETQVTRFAFDAVYWNDVLLPALRSFYFELFLPRLALRASGRLQPGEIECPGDPAADVRLYGRKRPAAKRPRPQEEVTAVAELPLWPNSLDGWVTRECVDGPRDTSRASCGGRKTSDSGREAQGPGPADERDTAATRQGDTDQ